MDVLLKTQMSKAAFIIESLLELNQSKKSIISSNNISEGGDI